MPTKLEPSVNEVQHPSLAEQLALLTRVEDDLRLQLEDVNFGSLSASSYVVTRKDNGRVLGTVRCSTNYWQFTAEALNFPDFPAKDFGPYAPDRDEAVHKGLGLLRLAVAQRKVAS